jgi:pilus assembly protein CpaE
MDNEQNLTRVALLCEPNDTLTQVSAALAAQNEFFFSGALSDLERLGPELTNMDPDIILIDHVIGGQVTLDIIDNLLTQFPEAAIVAILPREDPLLVQQVMLAGSRAFVIQPFTQINLLSILRRVRDLQQRQRQLRPVSTTAVHDTSRPPRTIAVFSPRGGVGTSTLATNLAVVIHEETNSKVLLLEGKLYFGHLNVLLNLRPRNNLADLIPHASNIDEALVRDVVSTHISGIYVLPAPSDLQVAQGIRPQDMFTIVSKIQRFFDYIVIDAGSSLNENTVTLMDFADRILVVTTPDLAALHDASRFIRISQTLAYPSEKVLLVLNQADRPGGVKPKEIKTVLHWGIFAEIPDDTLNATRSLNRGVPLVINNPRSPASRSYYTIAKHFTNTSPK